MMRQIHPDWERLQISNWFGPILEGRHPVKYSTEVCTRKGGNEGTVIGIRDADNLAISNKDDVVGIRRSFNRVTLMGGGILTSRPTKMAGNQRAQHLAGTRKLGNCCWLRPALPIWAIEKIPGCFDFPLSLSLSLFSSPLRLLHPSSSILFSLFCTVGRPRLNWLLPVQFPPLPSFIPSYVSSLVFLVLPRCPNCS